MSSVVSLVAAQAAVAATWAILAVALCGIGLFARRKDLVEPFDLQEGFLAFWYGFSLVLLLLQLWHLVLPVDALALCIILVAGASGLTRHRASLRAWLARRPWAGHGLALIAAAALVAYASNRALGPPAHFDNGVYHIPTVEWAKAYAIVPGLANLHGRLGFNSASLLWAAALDHGPWAHRAYHVADSLLIVLFGLQSWTGWMTVTSAGGRPRQADFVDALLLLPVVALLIGGEVSTIETDLPAAVMLFFVASRLLRSSGEALPPARMRADAAAVATVLAAAVCVKLSTVVMAAALLLVCLWVYRNGFVAMSRPVRTAAIALAPALVLGLAWMVRGVILSGYPVYPASFFGIAVPWRVPAAQAIAEGEWIRMSARALLSNRLTAGFDWLRPWLTGVFSDARLVFLVPVPLAIALVFGGTAVTRRRSASTGSRDALRLLAAAGAGVVFWFSAAPHPRFGMAPLWLVTAGCAGWWFTTIPDDDDRRRRASRRVGVVLAALVGVAVIALAATQERAGLRRLANRTTMMGGLLFRPGDDHGFHPVPRAQLASYTTTSRLELAVPIDSNRCWQGPLLCTPQPAPNLRLRAPGDLAAGFTVEPAVWTPLRFPNATTPFLAWMACRRGPDPGVARDRMCIAKTADLKTDSLGRLLAPRPADQRVPAAPGSR